MAHRVTRGRTKVVGNPRLPVWFDVNQGSTLLTASSNTLISVYNAAALSARPFTVIRTRLELLYFSDSEAVDETPFGALGMTVVSQKAAALGITAIPTPITNSDGDWFMWQGLAAANRFGGSEADSLFQRTVIDSKAMRKIGVDDSVAIVVEQSAAVGATIVIQGRQLVKFH